MSSYLRTSLWLGWTLLAAVSFGGDTHGSEECRLFAATGDVTRDSITILAKTRDLYWKKEQRIWYSPRAAHDQGDTIYFRNISIPQCSLTYKFIATNSYVKDQTAGYGINEYGLGIISHDMDSWDDDDLGSEYFHDQDYVALVLARCQNASEAIDLFDELILPCGINAETYLIADPGGLWLLETTGLNWVAKPICDDVISCQYQRYNIRTEWRDPGNRWNSDLVANAAAHGCDTVSLDFAGCFGNRPPGILDPDLQALEQRGDIIVQDIRDLVRNKADNSTVAASVMTIRPDKDADYFSFMWDSRADPEYGNIFLPLWIAVSDSALPDHYTSWPPEDPDCAWKKFTKIVNDPALRDAAEPIWLAWQEELDVEFDTVEMTMQNYLDVDDTSGLRVYIDEYVFDTLNSAYWLAVEIITKAGVPHPVSDLIGKKAGEDLMLEWSPVTEDGLGNPVIVDHYYIYRQKELLSKPGLEPLDTVDVCFYLDTTGVVGDPEVLYRYWVTAIADGKQSAPSGQVGGFNRHLMNFE